MTLREQLGERLRLIANEVYSKQHPRINARGAILEHYDAMAEECIRQMEWARSRPILKFAGFYLGPPTLSMAPEGWTPGDKA